jgi:hypothetical protein
MAVFGEKLGGGPADWSAVVRRIVSEALFLKNSRVRPTLLGQHKRLPCTGADRRKRTSGLRGPTQEVYVTCVLGFPCRLYINSNCCDAHI